MAIQTAALLISGLAMSIASDAPTAHPPGASEAMHKAARVTPMKDVKNMNIFCPHDHCLKRVKKGDTAASFHCKRHAHYIGHICAGEGGMCNCPNGKIKYGNFVSAAKPEAWTQPIMGGTTAKGCSNDVFGSDPIPGGAKFCHCTPHNAWWVPQETTEVPAKCGATAPVYTTGLAWAEPTCIEASVAINSGLPSATVWGMGMNFAAANIVVGMSFNTWLSTTGCHVPFFNLQATDFTNKDVLSDVTCNVTSTLRNLLQKFDEVQASTAALQTAKDTFIDANVVILKELAAMKSVINFEMKPNITSMGAAPPICTIKVPDPYPAASGAVKTGLATISASIMLAVAAWFQW